MLAVSIVVRIPWDRLKKYWEEIHALEKLLDCIKNQFYSISISQNQLKEEWDSSVIIQQKILNTNSINGDILILSKFWLCHNNIDMKLLFYFLYFLVNVGVFVLNSEAISSIHVMLITLTKIIVNSLVTRTGKSNTFSLLAHKRREIMFTTPSQEMFNQYLFDGFFSMVHYFHLAVCFWVYLPHPIMFIFLFCLPTLIGVHSQS